MKVWSRGTVLLVLGSAGAGWMAGHAEDLRRPDASVQAEEIVSTWTAVDERALAGSAEQPPVRVPTPFALTRAERSGVSDVVRRSTQLIESQRHKPMFGEWSMKYLVVDDALRADVNQDGWLTSEDFATFVVWMQQGDACADLNVDGLIDSRDMALFVEAFTSEELIEVRRDESRAC